MPALHSVALVLFCLHAKVTNYLTRHEQLSETNRPGAPPVTDAQLRSSARAGSIACSCAVDTHTPLESPHADILYEPGTFVRTLRGGASCGAVHEAELLPRRHGAQTGLLHITCLALLSLAMTERMTTLCLERRPRVDRARRRLSSRWDDRLPGAAIPHPALSDRIAAVRDGLCVRGELRWLRDARWNSLGLALASIVRDHADRPTGQARARLGFGRRGRRRKQLSCARLGSRLRHLRLRWRPHHDRCSNRCSIYGHRWDGLDLGRC